MLALTSSEELGAAGPASECLGALAGPEHPTTQGRWGVAGVHGGPRFELDRPDLGTGKKVVRVCFISAVPRAQQVGVLMFEPAMVVSEVTVAGSGREKFTEKVAR